MSVIEFSDKRPWMKPQENFEDDAMNFAVGSPYGWELVKALQSCASPFIRAAIILCACTAEDVPFLLRIAEQRKPNLLSPNPPAKPNCPICSGTGWVPTESGNAESLCSCVET